MSVYLKGHQSCSMSKLEGFDLLHKNGVVKDFLIWHLVTLFPLLVQRHFLPFGKPLIYISSEPDCPGCYSTLTICQAMLKIGVLLKSPCLQGSLDFRDIFPQIDFCITWSKSLLKQAIWPILEVSGTILANR